MTDKPTTWQWEGALEIWDQEGGYASPAVDIGGQDLGWAIVDTLVGQTAFADLVDQTAFAKACLLKPEGKWRITLEKIE